jgi:membrane fusion protein, multidrug efflux system
MKLKAGIAVLIAPMMMGACGTKPQAAAEKPALVPGVKIARVANSSVDDYYEAVGTVRAATSSVLSARITGSVVAVHVREGDRVKAGALLVEIDNRDGAAQLQKAQAGLREAEQSLEEVDQSTRAAESAKAAADAQKQLALATFNRYKALLDRHSVSPQEFDEVQARNRVAEAEADRAEKMLKTLAARRSQMLARIDQARADIAAAQLYAGYARITSPVSGVVTAKRTDIGQTAAPGTPLVTVEDDSHYRLEAAVEESRIGTVHRGDAVSVLIDALGDEEFESSVDEIVPASDPSSRSVTMKVSLPAQAMGQGIRSGMFGKARLKTGQRQAILVPRQAIVNRGQLTGVFVIDDSGIARLRLIKTGRRYGDQVEVLSGLTDGERAIVEGAEAMKDGAKVE